MTSCIPMTSLSKARGPVPLFALAFFLFLTLPARAHVALDSPNGGESYRPGQKVMIQWHPLVNHGTTGWALFYSTGGPGGPWIVIDNMIPAGAISPGSPHSYLWTVPQLTAANVWVRVQMINPGTDYFDVSNSSFEIKDALSGNVTQLSISAGGVQVLDVDAGPDLGSLTFAVLGNFTGTFPGISYQGWTIPLNQDFYFDQTVLLPNYAPLTNSLGLLDTAGLAQTLFTLPAGALDPSTAGIVLHHAALVVDSSFQVQLVSNAVPLTLVP